MNIYVIYGSNPTTPFLGKLDVAETFDFSLHKPTGKLVLNRKQMTPAIDMRAPWENIEVTNFTFGHLTVEIPVFMDWVKHMMDFCKILQQEICEPMSAPPFDAFIRAISSFRSCNQAAVNKIALDFIKWKPHAERFGPDTFLGGYELMEKAFVTARNNGGVWIKHM